MNIKERLIDECLKKLNNTADNAKKAMEEHQQLANEYGVPKDRYDSFRMQMLRKRDMYAVQYNKSLEEINILNKIDPNEKKNSVELGAVVITENQKLFISVSIGKIIIENTEYFAVSPAVPICKEILGKKINDTFIFNGIKNSIKEIY